MTSDTPSPEAEPPSNVSASTRRVVVLLGAVLLGIAVGVGVAPWFAGSSPLDAAAGPTPAPFTESPSVAPRAVDAADESPAPGPESPDVEPPSPTRLPSPDDAPVVETEAVANASSRDNEPTGSDDADASTAATEQVCTRIVALGDDVASRDRSPLDVYLELLDIRRDAAGTPLEGAVDDAVGVVQQAALGRADGEAVVEAGAQLLARCR